MKLIPLSKGLSAQVSDEDYESLSKFKWCASLESRGTKWYAVRWMSVARGKRVKLRMHCVVMGRLPLPNDGLVVHHRDDDSLNNQRENLEVITQTENMQRSQGWKKKGIPVDCFL
jgi:hypothetical protein